VLGEDRFVYPRVLSLTTRKQQEKKMLPTTFDELEAEGNKENLGGFGGDFQARKKLQEMLQDMSRQTERMINEAVEKEEAAEAEKEANEWYARKDKLVKVVSNIDTREVVAGSVLSAATIAGAILAPGYVAKAGVVMAGVALLGAGYYFRNKLFKK
jgi:hypothetical protein